MNKPKSERFQQLFKDIADAPSGPISADFVPVTVKDNFSDLFIRTLAGHLLSLGYVRQEGQEALEERDDAAPQHPIKTKALCDTCRWDKECCKHISCKDCPSYIVIDEDEFGTCKCVTIKEGAPCRFYEEVNT